MPEDSLNKSDEAFFVKSAAKREQPEKSYYSLDIGCDPDEMTHDQLVRYAELLKGEVTNLKQQFIGNEQAALGPEVLSSTRMPSAISEKINEI